MIQSLARVEHPMADSTHDCNYEQACNNLICRHDNLRDNEDVDVIHRPIRHESFGPWDYTKRWLSSCHGPCIDCWCRATS